MIWFLRRISIQGHSSWKNTFAKKSGWWAAQAPWAPPGYASLPHQLPIELLAACFTIKTLRKCQKDKRVLLLLDKQSAVVYVNYLGETVSAKSKMIVAKISMWCLQKRILLSAQYLGGKTSQSRTLSRGSFTTALTTCWPRVVGVQPAPQSQYQSFCVASYFPAFTIVQLEVRSSSRSGRCLSTRMMNFVGAWQSSEKPDRKSPVNSGYKQAAEVIFVAAISPSQPWYNKLLRLLSSTSNKIPPWLRGSYMGFLGALSKVGKLQYTLECLFR